MAAAVSVVAIAASAATVLGMLRLVRMEREARLILSRWQTIDGLSNDALLRRSSLADGGYADLLSDWERRTLELSLCLARFNDPRHLGPLGKEVVSDVGGAVALWVATEERLREAQQSLRRMIRSGLGDKVMTNGFLPTFFMLRVEGLLEEMEIIEIQDTVHALRILDATTEQFDLRLKAVVARVAEVAERRIVKAAGLALAGIGGFAVLVYLGYFYFTRMKVAERFRREEEDRLRRDYLAEWFDPDAAVPVEGETQEEGRRRVAAALRNLGEELPFRDQIALLVMCFDRPAPPLEALRAAAAEAEGPERRDFPVGQDCLALLLDATSGDGPILAYAEALRDRTGGSSISFALSPIFGAEEDGREVLRRTLEAFGYRYILGPGAAILPGSGAVVTSACYDYPSRLEDMATKRILEGDMAGAKGVIGELIGGARVCTPAMARAAVARITASVLSAVERLERAADIVLDSATLEGLSQSADLDTLEGAKRSIGETLDELERALERRGRERTADLVEKAKALAAEHFADPNLSLDILADRLAMSSSYLGRTFRKQQGCSVAEHINRLRLERAYEYLQVLDYTVEGVASEVGIRNPGSFYRLFKQRYGITPAEHRAKAKRAAGTNPS